MCNNFSPNTLHIRKAFAYIKIQIFQHSHMVTRISKLESKAWLTNIWLVCSSFLLNAEQVEMNKVFGSEP